MFLLQVVKSKIGSYDVKVYSLRHGIRELKGEVLETANVRA